MNTSTRSILAAVVVIIGIILMIGGIVTGKHGATVVGIIVSGVAAQQFMALRNRNKSDETK